MNNVKQILKSIYHVSKQEGTDVYAVGGYVRDLFLGIDKEQGERNKEKGTRRKGKVDIDFVVIGSGLGFARALAEYFGEEYGSLVEFPDFDTARYVIKVESRKSKVESEGIEEYDYKTIEIEFAGARGEIYDKDSRKPKVVSTTLEEDLRRRDFTVNAMARKVIASGLGSKVIDPFDGQKDLEKKILRTPLDPDETFSEDPLRMMRAARFAAQLDFSIYPDTYDAIKRNKQRLSIISAERIQEELFKLLATKKPSVGLWILHNTGLLAEFLPEVCELAGVEEIGGKGHKDNLSHTFKVVDNLATRSDNVLLRYAALMHDIGKPGTKKFQKGRGWTFDMHEHLGRKIVRQIGKRLRMSKHDTEYIAHLVRWHQQPIALMDGGVTDSPVRRLVVNLQDNLTDLMMLCRSDITTGNENKLKRRLKNYDVLEKRIVEVLEKDKLRAFQSPLRGEEIMDLCGLKPGPTVGKIKKVLEDAILDGIIPNDYEATKKYFYEIKDEYLAHVEDWEKE